MIFFYTDILSMISAVGKSMPAGSSSQQEQITHRIPDTTNSSVALTEFSSSTVNRNNKVSRIFSHVKMEHLVAGMTGGAASTLILHPLDLVKIRFAVNDGLSTRPQYNGLFHAFKSILKEEGVKGLYR